MIVQELQLYLQQHPRVALDHLCQHFHLEPEALRPMLSLLIRKGRVRPWADQPCGGCHRCGAAGGELYEWVRDAHRKNTEGTPNYT